MTPTPDHLGDTRADLHRHTQLTYSDNHNIERDSMTQEDIDHILASITSRASELGRIDPTEGTTTDIARRLSAIREIMTALRDIDDRLAEDLAARMEEDEMTITGVGAIRRKSRTSSTWQDDTSRERMYDDAIHEIVRRTCVDPSTGEIHGPLAMVAREVWRLTHDCFSFTADPKVAFRRVLGLAPDEYRSRRTTGHTITIEEETL